MIGELTYLEAAKSYYLVCRYPDAPCGSDASCDVGAVFDECPVLVAVASCEWWCLDGWRVVNCGPVGEMYAIHLWVG